MGSSGGGLIQSNYVGLSADVRPTPAAGAGSTYFETDTKKFFTWDGSGWNDISGGSLTFFAPTFQNSWVNFSTVNWGATGYAKDAQGIVHLRGLIKDGTINQPVFTLPAGYRPSFPLIFSVFNSAGSSVRLDIRPDGVVVVLGGVNAWVSLSGLCFGTV